MPRHPSRGTGHGGPAKGSGWGGEASGIPAKGAGQNPFPKFNRAAVGHAPHDKERLEWRRQKAWEHENLLDFYAEHAEREETRILAAKHLHAICDGMPTARTELTGKNGGPLEVDSPGERIASRLAGLAPRSGTPSDPE